mmetsp:Transcript_74658/g.178091  ORF Transcript_74658/g.178091 Transcript_74658/m.178091 type:complete len:112 (+) Transcript_74658:24-359(+)
MSDITTRSQAHGSSQLRLQTTWSNSLHGPASRKAALQMHRLLTQCDEVCLQCALFLRKCPTGLHLLLLLARTPQFPMVLKGLTQCEELETQYTLSFNKRIELNLKFFPAIS